MLIYVVLILLSGLWLFLLSQGLDNSESVMHTLNNVINTPAAKSVEGLIEVVTPHLFAIGTFDLCNSTLHVVQHQSFTKSVTDGCNVSFCFRVVGYLFLLCNYFWISGIRMDKTFSDVAICVVIFGATFVGWFFIVVYPLYIDQCLYISKEYLPVFIYNNKSRYLSDFLEMPMLQLWASQRSLWHRHLFWHCLQ